MKDRKKPQGIITSYYISTVLNTELILVMLKNIQKGVKNGYPSNGQNIFYKEPKTHHLDKKNQRQKTTKP